MTYLDYAASSPIDPRVARLMHEVYVEDPGNPSSRTHLHGENCRSVVENARSSIASLANVEPDEIIFTSGATESDNLAIRGLLKYGEENGKRHIVSSAIEHKAVLNTLKYIEGRGFEVTLIEPDPSGSISADEVLTAVRDDTLLVSIMHANNETGVIQPVEEIGKELFSFNNRPYYHIDAAQTAGKVCPLFEGMLFDLVSLSAHKMYGPQGVGALVLQKHQYQAPPMEQIAFGGDQEQGLRPGTLPTALIAGFGMAATIARDEWSTDEELAVSLKNKIVSQIDESGVRYAVNGCGNVLPNIINVRFPGVSSEALMIAVKTRLSISNGSACTSGSYAPSHVLLAMGLSESEATESVRLSWGRGVDEEESCEAISYLLEVVKSLQ